LLVVIAIIAILAAMLLPALQSAKATAQKVTCLNNLKQLSLGHQSYADENNGYYPLAYGPPEQDWPSTSSQYPTWPRASMVDHLGFAAGFPYARPPWSGPRTDQPFLCPAYLGKTPAMLNDDRFSGAYISYTYNARLGVLYIPWDAQVWDGSNIPKPPARLQSSGHNWAGGPSDKAFIIDGTNDNFTKIAYQEKYFRLYHGVSSGQKGILSRHPANSNNTVYFDGHAGSVSRDALATQDQAARLWWPKW
jgi:type II secretory pathway pseudopilin PulG